MVLSCRIPLRRKDFRGHSTRRPGLLHHRDNRVATPTKGDTIMPSPRHAAQTAPQFVTIADAAEQLGVCTRTIHRYISTGQLRAYRVAERTIRLDRADVLALARPIPTAADAGAV